MSGPKTSSYSVDYEARRRMLEQQRLERERREEERKVRYETGVFTGNKSRIKTLADQINEVLKAVQDIASKTGKEFEIVEEIKQKLAELLKSEENVGSPSDKDSRTLHSNNAELSAIIQKLLALFKQLSDFSDEIHNEYYQKLDVLIKCGYFLSYSPEVIREIHNNKSVKAELEEMDGIVSGFDPDGLPDDFMMRYRSLLAEAGEIKDAKRLRMFVQTMIKPFVEESAEYRRLLAEFEAACITYYALADVYETDPIDFESYKGSISKLKKGLSILNEQIEILEKADMSEREIGYIYAALDEAMAELGYSLCADSESTKRTKVVRHQLYAMHDDMYIDVHFSDDGQISMQIGKGDNVDRTPTAEEATELVAEMVNFCGSYERLEEALRAKGVNTRRIMATPPAANCAEIINVAEFGQAVPQTVKQTKTREEKAKQKTKEVKTRRRKKEKAKAMARTLD